MNPSRCCWFHPCLLTAVEFWTPKPDSIATDGGMLAYCIKHRIDGAERQIVCARVGYNFFEHQKAIHDHYIIERVDGVVSFPLLQPPSVAAG